ncbi:hypothetical protein V5O48_018607, partial [Marasmius crinis-equi]
MQVFPKGSKSDVHGFDSSRTKVNGAYLVGSYGTESEWGRGSNVLVLSEAQWSTGWKRWSGMFSRDAQAQIVG